MSEAPKTSTFNASKSNFGTRGWILVIYCFLAMFCTTAVGNSITNLAFPQMCEMFGWNYYNLTAVRTLTGWFTVVFFLVFGALLRKQKAKTWSIICGLAYMVSTLIFPSINKAWQYVVVCCLLQGILGNCWYNQFNNILQSNWFPRKKGLVVGWTTMALPIGAAVGTKLYFMLFGKLGMAGTYYIYAGLCLVTVLLCVIFLKDYPEEVGCFPDNDPNMTTEQAKAAMLENIEKSKNSYWTAKRLLSIKEFWLMGCSLGIQMLFASAFMGVIVPRAMAAGYDQGTAVNFMMIAGLCGGVGSYVVGVIDSKTNPKVAAMIVHIFAILSCVLNILPFRITFVISMVFLGVVLGGAANCLMSMVSTMWGRYGFSNAFAKFLVINQVIGSAGSALVAKIAEAASWNMSYIVVACLAVVGILLLLPVKLDSIYKYEEAAGWDMSAR